MKRIGILMGGVSSEHEVSLMSGEEVLKIDTFSRVDMILRGKTPYLLEINTIPGLTSHSLLPKSAKAYGISFSELISVIIEPKYEL